MNHRDGKQARAKPLDPIGGTLTAVGWTSRHKIFSPPVEAELFFLTSLFIELTDLVVGLWRKIAVIKT